MRMRRRLGICVERQCIGALATKVARKFGATRALEAGDARGFALEPCRVCVCVCVGVCVGVCAEVPPPHLGKGLVQSFSR